MVPAHPPEMVVMAVKATACVCVCGTNKCVCLLSTLSPPPIFFHSPKDSVMGGSEVSRQAFAEHLRTLAPSLEKATKNNIMEAALVSILLSRGRRSSPSSLGGGFAHNAYIHTRTHILSVDSLL